MEHGCEAAEGWKGMRNLAEEKNFFITMFDMLEAHFGADVELVLHDLTNEYEHSIVDIRNGHITGRKIGDCGDDLGLEVLSGSTDDGNSYNEILRTEDGKILRCSTIFIYGDDGAVIGSICINQDITRTLAMEEYLRAHINKSSTEAKETFTKDVNTLLTNLIEDAHRHVGKEPEDMTKEDKQEFIRYLDERGAFLNTKSGTRVCNYLSISKYTLYNYRDIGRELVVQEAD